MAAVYLVSAIQRRADELNKLSELPDTPACADAEPAASKVAGLPTDNSSELKLNEETGPNAQQLTAPARVDVDESLAIEFLVAPPTPDLPRGPTPAVFGVIPSG